MKPPCPINIEISPAQSIDGMVRLGETIKALAALDPEFISVTYGAGGCTRDASLDCLRLVRDTGTTAVPHISAAGAGREDIRSLLRTYKELDIGRLVVLRGDASSGLQGRGEFPFASDLVRFVREESGDRFHIDVAAYPEVHPQARDCNTDLASFKSKIDAGADSAITQYFFNPDAYQDFVERCLKAGITAPIVPGIMPIAGFSRLLRFSESHGIDVPAWIRRRIEAFGDDHASIRAFGIELISRLCERLLAIGAPGLHFFSLNDASRITDIHRMLISGHTAGDRRAMRN